MDIRVKQQAKPFYLVLVRLVVMVALAIVTYSILAAIGMSSDFPPLDMLYFPFVNIICGIVIWRTFRQHDTPIWAYLGFEKRRIGKDIAWGFLWLIVTYIPMVVDLDGGKCISCLVLTCSNNFEQVFSKSHPQLPGGVIAVTSIFSAIVFLANAPIEEIIYRGWLQNGLMQRHGTMIAIAVQGLLFGLQHTMFAVDVRGMVVYGFMFFAWGITAGIIVYKQKRLAPMVIAHWIVNVAFGVGLVS